ncbi:MAG: (Fe-S)-binding protein, partial [Halobacteriota archaeon]
WDADRVPRTSGEAAERRVLLVPDPTTNYVDPGPGKAAIEVLEAAGCRVELAPNAEDTGRSAYSNGLLDRASEQARDTVETLTPRVAAGWDVVYVEPSDAVMVQDEYADLLSGLDDVSALQANTYGIMEYVDTFALDEAIEWETPDVALTYHGHCHQKSVGTDHHAARVLERVGYAVDELDSSCCGMAGSFGYEAEHYELSTAVGDILFQQVEESEGERVTTPGASCRTQFGDSEVVEETPPHPVEELAIALP